MRAVQIVRDRGGLGPSSLREEVNRRRAAPFFLADGSLRRASKGTFSVAAPLPRPTVTFRTYAIRVHGAQTAMSGSRSIEMREASKSAILPANWVPCPRPAAGLLIVKLESRTKASRRRRTPFLSCVDPAGDAIITIPCRTKRGHRRGERGRAGEGGITSIAISNVAESFGFLSPTPPRRKRVVLDGELRQLPAAQRQHKAARDFIARRECRPPSCRRSLRLGSLPAGAFAPRPSTCRFERQESGTEQVKCPSHGS